MNVGTRLGPVAFVFSGGAALAAYQVGMVRAAYEFGLRPNLLVGVSAGAINAAFLAQKPDADIQELEQAWAGISSRDVFAERLPSKLWRLARGAPAIYGNAALTKLLGRVFGAHARIEDCSLPLGILAARVPSGLPKVFSTGEMIPAILASTAIPGIFPSIVMDGVRYVDGSIVSSVPLVPAVLMGAQSIVVFDAGPPCEASKVGTPSIAQALSAAVTMSTRQRIAVHLPDLGQRHRILYLSAPCDMAHSALDFGATPYRIEAGYRTAKATLTKGWPDGPGVTGMPHLHDDPYQASSWGLPEYKP